MQRQIQALFMSLLLMLVICSQALAGVNQWSGSGPFATGLGNRVITAMAVSPDNGTVYSGTASGTVFSYAVTAPNAATNAATAVTATGATLNGTVNPLNASGVVTFEYGATTGYGTVVDAANPNHDVSGSTDINPAATIGGLLPNTLYHFRVVIETTSGKTYGGDQTFTTLKLNQAITFPLLGDKTYGDIPFNISASSDSLLPVTLTSQTTTVCTVSGTTVTIKKIGPCTIAADQAGDSTYYQAPQVLQGFNVTRALLTVTPDNRTRLYGQSNPAFPVTITGFVYTDTVTTSGITGSGSGNCAAMVTSPVGGAYIIIGNIGTLDAPNYAFAAADGTLTINKAHLTVTADDQTREYGKLNPVFTTTITGFVNGEDATSAAVSGSATGSSTATVNSPAGATYTITGGTGDLAAANYDFIPADGILTITKTSQTINFGSAPITKTYGAADFGPGAVASSGLPVTYGIDTPAVGAITPAGLVHINGAGSALITASQAGDTNYLPATANQSLVVDKATLMVQANNASRSAGVANPAFTANYSGFVNGETVAVISGAPDFFTPTDLASPAGEYPILPLPGTLASANYIFNFFPGILAVDLQSQTITLDALPIKTYGNAPFSLNVSSTSANPIVLQSSNPAVATIAGNTVTIAGPGTALITASQLGDSTYALAVAMQLLTVDKATLTVAADNASKLFGDPNPSFTYTASGFIGADTQLNACSGAPDLTTTAILASPAGSYPITAAAGTLSCAKYNPVFVNGVLAVGITSQNITFAPLAPVTYGDASFALSASGGASGNPVTFSSSNPAVATVSGTTVTITGAGSTTILANQAGTDSYAPASAQQILTVNKMNLTVTADAKGRGYNVANPPLTYTYGAFAYSDTQTVLAGAPQLSTTALITSGVGSYPITVAANNLSAANYDFTFGNSTLTVAQATPVITWSNPADIIYGTTLGAGQLNATFNTAGTPVYTPLSGTILSAGPTQNLIVDFTPTDAVNYTTASKTVAINVSKAAQTITFNPPASTTYGAAPITLSASGGLSGNPVTFAYVSGPGSLVGSIITITGAGDIVVSASQLGDANYNAAATVQKTVTVNKATQAALTTVITPSTVVYGSTAALSTTGGSGTGTVTYSAGASTGCSVTGSTLSVTDASGICAVTATKATDTNYSAATSLAATVVLQKAAQAALNIVAPSDLTIGSTATLSSTGGSGTGGVTYSAGASTGCLVTGTTLSVTNEAGTCSVTAAKAADGNYNAATSAAATVALHPLNAITGIVVTGNGTIVCTPSGVTYGGGFTCTLCPSLGYDLYRLFDNSVNRTGSCSVDGNCYAYSLANVTSDHKIKVNYSNCPVLTISGGNGDCEPSITSAIVPVQSGDRILARAITFVEDVDFNKPGMLLSLEGGYDPGFSSPIGQSIIRGSVTISDGMVVIEDIIIW